MHLLSPFYALLEGAMPFELVFPAHKIGGPHWDGTGELIRHTDDKLIFENIEAVQIGPDHYRLACRRDGPFSLLRLHWGDEFMANAGSSDALTLTRVIVPQRHVHHRFLASGGFGNEHPMARLVHEAGGGWEALAGGLLTLTVPASRLEEFMRASAAAGNQPGALRLVE